MHYNDLRQKYPSIVYKSFKIVDEKDSIKVIYTYILGEYTFRPSISISKKDINNKSINKNTLSSLFFNYGLVDIINYFKLSCPKTIIIEAGFIDQDQINFFKKLIYNGLSEYFYRNNIQLSYDDFTNFIVKSDKVFKVDTSSNEGNGNLIMVGGGKDSIVSLELLNEEKENNLCFLFQRNIYPKNMPSYNTIDVAGYTLKKTVIFNAEIDPLLLQLNNEGFLNGHVPLSSQLAFAAYIMAYLNNKKFIIVSNEASSNEGNIQNTNVNHQYSKSYEFESDFREYTKKYLLKRIEYYSLLRPILEIQIAKLFSKYPKYFNVFRSCNLSSKNNNTSWCGNCPKCLFIYIILSPYIDLDILNNIFKKNLLDDTKLLDTFKGLLGSTTNKPFECVGTYQEVQYACTKTIQKLTNNRQTLPYLLEYYKNNYEEYVIDLEHYWNKDNYVPKYLSDKIRKELNINDQ